MVGVKWLAYVLDLRRPMPKDLLYEGTLAILR